MYVFLYTHYMAPVIKTIHPGAICTGMAAHIMSEEIIFCIPSKNKA